MKSKVQSLIGRRFGQLVVIARSPNVGMVTRWHCRCDCTQEAIVFRTSLISGSTKSCGCLKAHLDATRGPVWSGPRTHGACVKGSPVAREYRSWQGARSRCLRLTDPMYPDYGGRGITICDEWRDDFNMFLRDMGQRPQDTTLDRINNDGPYAPGNCRWATWKEQNNNRRRPAFWGTGRRFRRKGMSVAQVSA